MEENDDAMILPDEYIDMYEKPFDVTLESGEYSHFLYSYSQYFECFLTNKFFESA